MKSNWYGLRKQRLHCPRWQHIRSKRSPEAKNKTVLRDSALMMCGRIIAEPQWQRELLFEASHNLICHNCVRIAARWGINVELIA